VKGEFRIERRTTAWLVNVRNVDCRASLAMKLRGPFWRCWFVIPCPISFS